MDEKKPVFEVTVSVDGWATPPADKQIIVNDGPPQDVAVRIKSGDKVIVVDRAPPQS
ncbi:hypothetical protein [Bradyrhizobium icense]|uniref:hypothetical protein n=1 Tax=Bradyrhizobium icense TaxID=1274631 RepID=UPI0012EAEEB0|nr:hypothetical protein [Bradyrhizobium icense]